MILVVDELFKISWSHDLIRPCFSDTAAPLKDPFGRIVVADDFASEFAPPSPGFSFVSCVRRSHSA